jgi:hypothetical protein
MGYKIRLKNRSSVHVEAELRSMFSVLRHYRRIRVEIMRKQAGYLIYSRGLHDYEVGVVTST